MSQCLNVFEFHDYYYAVAAAAAAAAVEDSWHKTYIQTAFES